MLGIDRPGRAVLNQGCWALLWMTLFVALNLLTSLPVNPVLAADIPAPPITQTPIPSASVPSTTCGDRGACIATMLRMLNRDRARDGSLPVLSLAERQTVGSASCPGSYGHSAAMAQTGMIWHANSRFPHASFPANICLSYRTAAENVGESSSGNVVEDLQVLDRLMMSEPHGGRVCATTVNHACNILNPVFRYVGIGIYLKNGVTWLTEDFVG